MKNQRKPRDPKRSTSREVAPESVETARSSSSEPVEGYLGFHPLPATGFVVTQELVDQIRDAEGI